MRTSPAAPAGDEFPLYGGRPCLNLVATLGKRHVVPVELLPDTNAVTRWLSVAGVVPDGPPVLVTPAQRRRLIVLREAASRLVHSAMAGGELAGPDLELLNVTASRPGYAPQLPGPAAGAGLTWTAAHPFEAAMSELARDVITLLGSPLAARIKECAHPDCSRLFVDESQSGARRWCSMDRCGNLAKIAAYRRRARTH
jgi:predicted RNA-binding Zn ribbon-like protein